MKYNLITILGPTATGKTALAAALSSELGGEIISADSRQVYRGMTIGTGKDLDDYLVKDVLVPYHLIDIAETGYKYNVFEFQRDFLMAFAEIRARRRLPVLCGGTGLYIEAALKGYRMIEVPPNEELRLRLSKMPLDDLTNLLKSYGPLHNTTDVETVKRAVRAIEIAEYYRENTTREFNYPEIKSLVVGIEIPREERRNRISQRLKRRLEEGMVEEVKGLLDGGVDPETLIYYGLEYKYVTFYLLGRLSFKDMFSQLEIAIHQFAKRQMTWFRGMSRRGVEIQWIDGMLPLNEKVERIKKLL